MTRARDVTVWSIGRFDSVGKGARLAYVYAISIRAAIDGTDPDDVTRNVAIDANPLDSPPLISGSERYLLE